MMARSGCTSLIRILTVRLSCNTTMHDCHIPLQPQHVEPQQRHCHVLHWATAMLVQVRRGGQGVAFIGLRQYPLHLCPSSTVLRLLFKPLTAPQQPKAAAWSFCQAVICYEVIQVSQWQGQGFNPLLSCHCPTSGAHTHGLIDLQATHTVQFGSFQSELLIH